jgi:hypothetical protein
MLSVCWTVCERRSLVILVTLLGAKQGHPGSTDEGKSFVSKGFGTIRAIEPVV